MTHSPREKRTMEAIASQQCVNFDRSILAEYGNVVQDECTVHLLFIFDF